MDKHIKSTQFVHISVVSRIVSVAGEFAPDYNTDQIYDRLIQIIGNVAAMKNS